MSDKKTKRLFSVFGSIFFGLSVAAIGLIFMYGLVVAYGKAKETRSWQVTPCLVVKSEIQEFRPTPNSPFSYDSVVEYVYNYGGKERIGKSIKRVNGASSDRKRAEKKIAPFPQGKSTQCWVNPDDPDKAILKQSTLAPLYTLWFPGLFVVAGIGIVFNAIRRSTKNG
jgi:hypothetical protein|tara:strand:+ start:398 stop:901 length:504 start_codon:yes stop_codon:yes gene_type:complete